MKIKHLLFLIALNTATGFSQNLQNANWYFGNQAGVSFLANPLLPISLNNSQMNTAEGCASVSDQAGQLLFYTNGITVWNKNHQIMTNGTGLMGNNSSTQSAIIITRPEHNNNYYIVTIDGATGSRKGLYVSEVDMSDGFGEVILTTKNTPLKDHNNIPINISYSNGSEKLTSTFKKGGDYWLVTQIKNYIYSYLVTSSGISLTPTEVSAAPINLNTTDIANCIGQMKISPDASKIGICYSGDTGFVALGEFNNDTGEAVINPSFITIPGATNYYGIEFSPSGNYCYFSINGNIYQNSSINANTAINSFSIYRTDTELENSNYEKILEYSNNTSVEDYSLYTSSTPIPGGYDAASLQLAINDKIYFRRGSFTLSSIENADSASPNININAVNITYGSIILGLPQWVHRYYNTCPESIVLNVPEFNASPFIYQYSDYIITQDNYILAPNQDITMKAGDFILFKPGTKIQGGSKLLAKIEDCNAVTQNRAYNTTENKQIEPSKSLIKDKLMLVPNPTAYLTKITLEQSNIEHIEVFSVEGKLIFKEKLPNHSKEYNLDVSEFKDGIYIINVINQNGKHFTKKLIKE